MVTREKLRVGFRTSGVQGIKKYYICNQRCIPDLSVSGSYGVSAKMDKNKTRDITNMTKKIV